jgi:hypothetical protein
MRRFLQSGQAGQLVTVFDCCGLSASTLQAGSMEVRPCIAAMIPLSTWADNGQSKEDDETFTVDVALDLATFVVNHLDPTQPPDGATPQRHLFHRRHDLSRDTLPSGFAKVPRMKWRKNWMRKCGQKRSTPHVPFGPLPDWSARRKEDWKEEGGPRAKSVDRHSATRGGSWPKLCARLGSLARHVRPKCPSANDIP